VRFLMMPGPTAMFSSADTLPPWTSGQGLRAANVNKVVEALSLALRYDGRRRVYYVNEAIGDGLPQRSAACQDGCDRHNVAWLVLQALGPQHARPSSPGTR
jgi:hypothetical protein